MEYIEIDLDCGLSIIDSVKLLHSKAEATDKKYFGEFNGHKLTSDMTVDEAYIECLGRTSKDSSFKSIAIPNALVHSFRNSLPVVIFPSLI